MTLSHYGKTLQVNLGGPGIYNFEGDSATGKTYLCNLLKDLSISESVDGFSLYDSRKFKDLKSFIQGRRLKLLVIDRYDMYNGAYKKEIEELSETCIVLVDIKRNNPFYFNTCAISIREDSIEVDIL